MEHFLSLYASKNGKKIASIADDVLQMFLEYHWPGNIREFENAIEGAVIMAKTGEIQKWDVPNLGKFSGSDVPAAAQTNGKSLKEVMEQPERDLIIQALEEQDWNRNQAAAALGVNRTTLYNKMKKYKIPFKKGR